MDTTEFAAMLERLAVLYPERIKEIQIGKQRTRKALIF